MESTEVVGDNTNPVSDSIEQSSNTETRGEIKYKNDLIKYKQLASENERKAQELEERLQQIEIEKEEKNGNLSKVLDDYKSKTKTLEDKLKKQDYLFARSNIENAIKTEALKLGCKDVDVFSRLISKDKFDTISFDEGYRPDLEDIKSVVQEAVKTFSHIGLFNKDVKITDAAPKSTMDKGPEKKKSETELYDNYFKSKGWR